MHGHGHGHGGSLIITNYIYAPYTLIQ